jgi:hypothetical protein
MSGRTFSKADQPTDNLKRPQHPAAQGTDPSRTQSPPTAEHPASGHRVEAANALALANQEMVSELQELVGIAATAQQNAAKQTAAAFKVLLNREYFYGQLRQELAEVVKPAPLNLRFEPVTAKGLLPSGEQVLAESLQALGLPPVA